MAANWKVEYEREQARARRQSALIAMLAALLAAAFLVGIFVDPRVTIAATGAATFVGGAACVAFWVVRSRPAQISIRAGHVRVTVRLSNSPFNKEATNALLDGAVDYLLRGLRTGVLPELSDYRGPSTYLASPTSGNSEEAPAGHARPEARSRRPEATPVPAQTPLPSSGAATAPTPEALRHILTALPTTVETPREAATQQATAATPPAEAQETVAPAPAGECEICRCQAACATTEVFDGAAMLHVQACSDCIDENERQQEASGYPLLYKRGSGGGLVPHNAAPAPQPTDAS